MSIFSNDILLISDSTEITQCLKYLRDQGYTSVHCIKLSAIMGATFKKMLHY